GERVRESSSPFLPLPLSPFLDPPPVPLQMQKSDPKRTRRQEGLHPLRPLDHADALAVEELLDADLVQLAQPLDPVQVEVIEGRARGVLVDEGEGGRGHVLGVPSQPAREALDEVGLARAEVAVEGEHVAGAKVAGEALTEGEGLLRRSGLDREEGVERVIGGSVHRVINRLPTNRSAHPRGRSVATGSSISSMLTPPCWNVSWYWLR